MDSKQNTLKSTANCTDLAVYPEVYSLKTQILVEWMLRENCPPRYVSSQLGLTEDEFIVKLLLREKFNRQEIRKLIKLMGAEEAFKVLYFPSSVFRQKVWWQVFGKYRHKEELNE